MAKQKIGPISTFLDATHFLSNFLFICFALFLSLSLSLSLFLSSTHFPACLFCLRQQFWSSRNEWQSWISNKKLLMERFLGTHLLLRKSILRWFVIVRNGATSCPIAKMSWRQSKTAGRGGGGGVAEWSMAQVLRLVKNLYNSLK